MPALKGLSMSLRHYVPGTYFTTDEFRFIVELIYKKIESLKEDSKTDEQRQQLDRVHETMHQKLYGLTDHD